MPMTGILTVCATCHTILSATGFMAGPDNPPVMLARIGLRSSISIAIPVSVFINETASAPLLSTASAIAAMSVTLGVSFAMIG